MTTLPNPLGSAHWHQVAHWRPRLHERITVRRVWSRGQCWHILGREDKGQRCRLNAQAYAIAARLDGRVTVQDLWLHLEHVTDEPPTQDDMIAIIRQLMAQRLLTVDEVSQDQAVALLNPPPEPHADGPERAEGRSLLAWRIPLGNPSRWLRPLDPVLPWLFSRPAWWLWCAAMLALVSGLVIHGSALAAHAQAWLQTPRYLLLALIVYPVIKAIHEAGHALAVRRWGGDVHEAGLTLMLLMPVPYVDASAAHGFARRRQRAVVSGAGIMAELAMATVGLWWWRWSDPGLGQDLAYVVWFTAGVSTLLFNANPLQRLDGYHLLTDVADLPNLAGRSRQWWAHLLRDWLTGAPADHIHAEAPLSPGERPWLMAYAPLAWLFQLALWLGLTWWAGSLSAWLGLALGLMSAWLLLLKPAGRWLGIVWHSLLWTSGADPRRHRARRRALILLALPLVALLVPWPDSHVVQGVVWAPEKALLRPQVDGFVAAVHVDDGARVQVGQLLLTMSNHTLAAERDRAAAHLAQAEHDQFTNLGHDSAQAGKAGDEVQRLQARVARLDDQLAALQVRAQHEGRLILPRAQDLHGRYLQRGALLGHIVGQEQAMLRLAMDETEALPPGTAPKAVSVRLSGSPAHALAGTVWRDGMSAVRQLPSGALSQAVGGQIATDPQDKSHRRTVRPVILMDVQLPLRAADTRLGERGWVRLERGWSPPLAQIGRHLAQQGRRLFNPAQ